MKLSEIKIRDIPEALKNKIKRDAKKSGRSMNKQIVHVLSEVYK